MCGILGAIPSIDESLFRQALGRLAHRGPDGEAVWTQGEGKITLGHRRLAIIDRGESGVQPMRRGPLAITCNGEFYNYRELKSRLEGLGHSFTTQSDTEVFLAAWQQWGAAAFAECNGMWALGMWDEGRESLILARDRFGKKPLFYVETRGRFFFASEMKALFPFMDQVRPAANFREMASHMRDYESTSACLVEGIKRFPAGHWGEYKGGKLTLHRYWDTLDHMEEPPADFEGQKRRFQELLDDAVRLRMRADVPVGVALSGGLDSAAVLGTMAKISAKNLGIKAFTAGFPGTPFDESQDAARLAAANGTILNTIPVQAPSPETLRQQLWQFEDLHDNCPSPMVAVYKLMRANGVYVSLDGHGADELMGGYGEGLFHAFGDCGWNLRSIRSISEAYNHFYPDNPHFRKGKAGWMTALAYKMRGGKELQPEIVARLGHFGAYLFELYHQSIFPVMLRNYDRYSMMNGVEIRMPFADHRLVSYVFSLPWDSKLRNGYTKAILREAMTGRVPDQIRLKREKIGFPSPLVQWMQGPWREFLLDFCAAKWFQESALGEGRAVQGEVQALLNDLRADYFAGMRVWGRLAPFFWQWAVLDGQSSAPH